MIFNYMVSVIIPTYNSAHILGDSLGSVLSQTFKNWEIVLVDDASQDNTPTVVEKLIKNNNLNGRLRYIRHKKNLGVSSAKNTGIKAAKGEFISFLDADDTWYPYKLERVIKIFSKFPHVDLVCHNEFLSVNGKIKQKLEYSKKAAGIYLKDNEYVYRKLFSGNFLSTSAVTLKKHCLEEEIFDETILVAEDYDLWLRLSRKYGFYFLNEFLGEYRKIKTNALSNNIRRMYTGEIRVLKKNKNDIGKIIFYRRIFVIYFRVILEILKQGFFRQVDWIIYHVRAKYFSAGK